MTTPGELDERQRFEDDGEGVTAGTGNTIHQEVVIDIHVRHLKLQITEIAE